MSRRAPGRGRSRRSRLALGIEHLVERPTDTLSGGELQRVALAAALVLRPRLVLLDEPTSQLDPVAGDELIGLLRRLNEEWGMTVLLAEHRLERCLAAADRVLALDRRADPLRRLAARLLRVGARGGSRARDARGAAVLARRAGAAAGVGEGGAGGACAPLVARLSSLVSRGAGSAAAPAHGAGARGRGAGARCAAICGSSWIRVAARARCSGGSSSRSSRGRWWRSWVATGPARAPCCERVPRARSSPRAARRGRRADARCCRRARPTCWSASGSPRSSLATPAGGRWSRSGSAGPARATPATSPAASASGWRWRW